MKRPKLSPHESFLDISKVPAENPEEPSRLKYLDSTISEKVANLNNLIAPQEENKTPILPMIHERYLNLSGMNFSSDRNNALNPIAQESSFKAFLDAFDRRTPEKHIQEEVELN